jgi:hypothetical protein
LTVIVVVTTTTTTTTIILQLKFAFVPYLIICLL